MSLKHGEVYYERLCNVNSKPQFDNPFHTVS